MPIEADDAEYRKQAAEVKRLLRKLRPDPPALVAAPTGHAAPAGPTPTAGPPRATPNHVALPLNRPRPAPPGAARPTPGPRQAMRPLPSPLGVWGRAVLGLLLAGAMFFWPYRSCGILLGPYLGASAMVLVAGAWAGEASWRRRMGRAHIVAVMILLGGAAVAVRPLLPHVYATAETSWQCTPQ